MPRLVSLSEDMSPIAVVACLVCVQEKEACVYLTGPPGTGKTLLLILAALQWARRGHVVHVVSVESFSEASAQLVYYQVWFPFFLFVCLFVSLFFVFLFFFFFWPENS